MKTLKSDEGRWLLPNNNAKPRSFALKWAMKMKRKLTSKREIAQKVSDFDNFFPQKRNSFVKMLYSRVSSK